MYEQQAHTFKVLSDPNRLKIIQYLIEGQTCGCTLIDKLTITQPTLSYHLKSLSEAGIIDSKKEGTKIMHTVNLDLLSELSEFIKSLMNSSKTSC